MPLPEPGSVAPRARIRALVPDPLRTFIATESAASVVLLVAAVLALAWSNSPWSDSYFDLWHHEFSFTLGGYDAHFDARHAVNDGFMTLFFLIAGLEIRRELTHGELRGLRRAAFPIAGAAGGMILPALIFLAFTAGGDGSSGWGIPMATDIAFALGALQVLGKRVPAALKVFLLALAIVDDLGAIAVIAIFYSEGISIPWLATAALCCLAILALARLKVPGIAVYAAIGLVLWLAVLFSGIHATIAGVLFAFVVPGGALPRRHGESAAHGPEVPALERLEVLLHPSVSFVILPIFALANAGLAVDGDFVRAALRSDVTAGVFLGLMVGKTAGITLGAWLSVAIGIGTKPAGLRWPHIAGAAVLAGIGFTVALFVAGLAFDSPEIENEARAGILAASIIAGVLGVLFLRSVGLGGPDRTPGTPESPI